MILIDSTLRLVPFAESHLTQHYIDWLNNKEIVQYSELRHSVHTFDSCFAYWKSYVGSPNFFWAIEWYHDHHWIHIGNVNSYVNEKNKVADIGILIGEQIAWGQGIGFKVWSAVCNFLLNDFNMRKVTGGAMATNTAMIKIMQRAGMIEDGIRKEQYLYQGNAVDIHHYALFNGKLASKLPL